MDSIRKRGSFAMTPAAAEMLLIGILAGFFVSGVVQQLTPRPSRGA